MKPRKKGAQSSAFSVNCWLGVELPTFLGVEVSPEVIEIPIRYFFMEGRGK